MSNWSDLAEVVNGAVYGVFGETITYGRTGTTDFPITAVCSSGAADETDAGNFSTVEIRATDFDASPLSGSIPMDGDTVTLDDDESYIVIRVDNRVKLSGVYQLFLHAA